VSPIASKVLYGGSSFLRSLGNVLQYINEANNILWVLGDPAAERRFGYLMSRFMMIFHTIETDEAKNKWVNKIFQRVVEPGRRRHFQYRIHIIKDKSINAFALPGGYMFIHTGMLDFVKSDDELACVIGHELAHVNRRHSLNRLRRNYAFIELINQVFDSDTSSDRRNDKIAKATWLFLEQKNSRNNEREADKLGIKWAFEAGYNPSGMITLWKRMEEKYPYQKDLLTKILATHPPHGERSSNGRKFLKKYNMEFIDTDFLTFKVSTPTEKKQQINGNFEHSRRSRNFGWKLTQGVQFTKNEGRLNSNGLLFIRTDTNDECTARSRAIKFNSRQFIKLSASAKGGKTNPGALWVGVEFLNKDKSPLDVAFFAAEGIKSLPDKWITFSKSFNENGKDMEWIPVKTRWCRVVLAGCDNETDKVWIDDVSLSLGNIPDSSTSTSEGSSAPQRGIARKNILPNSDFENNLSGNGKPDRWTCSGGTFLSTTKPSRGASCLTFKGVKAGRREFAISERIPVNPGSRYLLEGLFKSDAKTEVTFGVRIFSQDYKELKAGQDLQKHKVSRNVWTTREQRITVPPIEGSLYLQIWIRCRPEIGKTVAVDNVRLFYGGVSK